MDLGTLGGRFRNPLKPPELDLPTKDSENGIDATDSTVNIKNFCGKQIQIRLGARWLRLRTR